MDKLTAFFEGIDFTKLVPEMDTVLGKAQAAASTAMMVGPILMLVLGLIYLFLAPKEANHKAGFRTWFGMGSVEAWQFTQRLAGLVWSGLGLVLTVIMGILCLGLPGREMMDMATTAFTCLIWQAVLAVAAYLAVCITCAVRYDSKGYRR